MVLVSAAFPSSMCDSCYLDNLLTQSFTTHRLSKSASTTYECLLDLNTSERLEKRPTYEMNAKKICPRVPNLDEYSKVSIIRPGLIIYNCSEVPLVLYL